MSIENFCGAEKQGAAITLKLASAHLVETRREGKNVIYRLTSEAVVAYCRGPFCLMAMEAVALLRKAGIQAIRLEDGVAEWRAGGLPVAV